MRLAAQIGGHTHYMKVYFNDIVPLNLKITPSTSHALAPPTGLSAWLLIQDSPARLLEAILKNQRADRFSKGQVRYGGCGCDVGGLIVLTNKGGY